MQVNICLESITSEAESQQAHTPPVCDGYHWESWARARLATAQRHLLPLLSLSLSRSISLFGQICC